MIRSTRRPWPLLLCLLPLPTLLIACGGTGGNDGATRIYGFSADPEVLPAGGGTTELRWDVEGADTLRIDPGVGVVTGDVVEVEVTTTTTFTLTATGATGTDTATTEVEVEGGGVSEAGLVVLTRDADGDVTGAAEFTGFSPPLADGDDPYAALVDTCEVFADTSTALPDPPDPFAARPGTTPTSLDAGAALTLRSGSGTYVTLDRVAETVAGETFYGYATAAPVSAPVPDDLELDVPGEDFPTFTGVAVPDAEPFDVATDDPADALTTVTRYTWSPGGGDDVILLGGEQVFYDDEEGDLLVVGFRCVAADDGEFVLPQDARDDLADNEFDGGNLSLASRLGYATETRAGALLVVGVETSDPDVTPTELPAF